LVSLKYEWKTEDLMKAVVYNKKSSTGKLVYADIEKPLPKDSGVLVKIHAASVNAADYRSMKMGIIPNKKIFGADIAGTVELAGNNTTLFKPGDEVIADLSDSGFGGFAEYVAIPEKLLAFKPKNLSFEEAAALPLASVTALQAIRDKGKIQRGHHVLILGSSGGVGSYAVQLARHFGGEVTAVCSTRNTEQARSLGADHVIDYTKENFAGGNKRYDLILAVNGNYPLLKCKQILKKSGIYVMAGGTLKQILKALLLGRFLSFGAKTVRAVAAKPNSEDLGFIAKLAEAGQLRPVIEKIYPLEETNEAMKYAGEGHAKGKVVIVVAGNSDRNS
jgi:NADPH:quinone reductase-like Zn-dependent oxidoreductase